MWETIDDLFGTEELVDWAHVVVDSSSVHDLPVGWAEPNPADRGKAGSRRHLLTDVPDLGRTEEAGSPVAAAQPVGRGCSR